MGKIKNNILFIVSLVLAIVVIVSLSFFTRVMADQDNEQHQENNTSTLKDATHDDEEDVENDENETSTDEEAEEKDNEIDADENDEDGKFDAKEYLNKEKRFKHNLSDAADREEEKDKDQDDDEIRDVVKEQEESASTTINVMEKVEHRNKIKTFLFGSDYKNLGVLRSEIVQTRNRLDKLDKLAEGLQNANDTAEIQAQSQALEQEMTKLENFIKEQEGKFSLFGWLIKMFNK